MRRFGSYASNISPKHQIAINYREFWFDDDYILSAASGDVYYWEGVDDEEDFEFNEKCKIIENVKFEKVDTPIPSFLLINQEKEANTNKVILDYEDNKLIAYLVNYGTATGVLSGINLGNPEQASASFTVFDNEKYTIAPGKVTIENRKVSFEKIFSLYDAIDYAMKNECSLDGFTPNEVVQQDTESVITLIYPDLEGFFRLFSESEDNDILIDVHNYTSGKSWVGNRFFATEELIEWIIEAMKPKEPN